MSIYQIKPLEWKIIDRHLGFIRAKSSAQGYYKYEIVRFLNPSSNEWSSWKLYISLDDKRFYPKYSGPISCAEYDTLEEAQEVANKHHADFVEQFLTKYPND